MAPFAATEPGISVLDSFANALFSLVESQQLTLAAAINAVTNAPAKAIGQNLGELSIEKRADICIVDMEGKTQLSAENMASKGHNNPWLGQSLPGKVMCTINGGHIVYQA